MKIGSLRMMHQAMGMKPFFQLDDRKGIKVRFKNDQAHLQQSTQVNCFI